MNEQWQRYFHHYATSLFPQLSARKRWCYNHDLCMIGCKMLLDETNDDVYRRAILACGAALADENGHMPGWNSAEHNLDTISFGKSLLVLHEVTHNKAYLQAALMVWRHLDSHPKVSTGNYWHKDIYPNQVWLDGLYMALPFSARCMELTQTQGYDAILAQFANVRRRLWVDEKKLYLHAWDESRLAEWADPETGCSPSFWLRAEGWYLMALVDCYEIISRHQEAAVLQTLLQEAIDGLLPYQDKASRMFLQVIDRADLPNNYPETSGSAMVAYALLKGTRLGMLPKTAAAKGEEILEGIRETYLADTADEPTLCGICASAGLGPGPDHRTDRDGSPAYYLSEKQIPDNYHGAAACMMACAELLHLQNNKEGSL